MRTDPKQSDENREEAGLEEALTLWMEIRQVGNTDYADRKGVVVWVTFGGWLLPLFYASGSVGCFGFNRYESLKPSY